MGIFYIKKYIVYYFILNCSFQEIKAFVLFFGWETEREKGKSARLEKSWENALRNHRKKIEKIEKIYAYARA